MIGFWFTVIAGCMLAACVPERMPGIAGGTVALLAMAAILWLGFGIDEAIVYEKKNQRS